jgi:hypothetical protein
MNEETYMEIHAICGDCGKKIKIKVNFEKTSLKDINKIVKMFHQPYNMACEKCSIKNMEKKK